ncbi:hypothetical protein ABT033_02820 [Streptomyces pharetrae]|uniref:hypothetical protein n=1 Tax=Streptomyces pharetrae TaxID=291370 RepID=UPI003356788A
MTRLKPSSVLTGPVRVTGSALRRMPGAGMVSKAAEGTLDTVGAVSPRGRRIAVYTGAGLLGVAGVVEWPVAVAGAAVAWLTQPKPGQRQEQRSGQESGVKTARAGDGAAARATTSAASRTAASGGPAASMATRSGAGSSSGASATASGGRTQVSGGPDTETGWTTVSGHRTTAARTKTVHGTGTTTIKAATAHRRTAARRRTAAMGAAGEQPSES